MSDKRKYPSRQPEYLRAYFRKWREKNRERITAYRKSRAKELAENRRERYAKDPAFRAKHKAKAQGYYLKNKHRVKAMVKAWQKAHPEKKNASKRKRYAEAHGHFHAKAIQYSSKRRVSGKAQEYRERNREHARALARKHAREVTDRYAREQLSKYSPISMRDWPQELVEAKKAQIKLKRQIKITT